MVAGGACVVARGCVWQGGHAWQRGVACVAKGGMRGKGGACVATAHHIELHILAPRKRTIL